MEFKVTINGLEQIKEAFRQAPLQITGTLQQAVLDSTKVLGSHTESPVVPYRTGNLVASFYLDLLGLSATWGPTANYAPFVEFGTDPHIILPKNAKALWWPGAKHPVKKVKHPGTLANPYMERIVSVSEAEINAIFTAAINKIIEDLAIS